MPAAPSSPTGRDHRDACGRSGGLERVELRDDAAAGRIQEGCSGRNPSLGDHVGQVVLEGP